MREIVSSRANSLLRKQILAVQQDVIDKGLNDAKRVAREQETLAAARYFYASSKVQVRY